MKKKKGFLAIFLCLCMLFFVGCGDGGPDDFDDDMDNSFGEVLSMEGVKVLSKPTEYDFGEAVGENSVNYYNEFAREILYGLYNIYEKPDVPQVFDPKQEETFFKDLNQINGRTFGSDDENDKYYLYDSLRYTIKSVQNTNDRVTITLDASRPWEWTIPYDETDQKIIFMTGGLADNAPNYSKLDDLSFEFDKDFRSSWTDIYSSDATIPAFPEFYYEGELKGEEENSKYYSSPYYQAVNGKEEGEDDAKNFFQDALEYATYMFVLGYDYVDENGQETADAPYFDFYVDTDPTTGVVENVTVGGWGNEKISVSYKQKDGGESALGRAKALYEKIGTYVGLTGEKFGPGNNIEQIERFIKDKVIGEAAWGTGDNAGGKFTVKVDSNTLTFNRNYEQIVKNVVNYACTKAPIGGEGDGQLHLDQPYLASDITDYRGNYFEQYVSGDRLDNYSDDDKFHLIEAAEYQSIIFMPLEAELDPKDPLFLSDITLYFEYWDGVSKTLAESQPNAKGKTHAESITINVGFRYYDHEANAYIANNEVKKEIKFGCFPKYEDYGRLSPQYNKDVDDHMIQFSNTDTAGCIPFDKNSKERPQIKTKFTSPTAIDAFANGTTIDGDDVKRIHINGGSEAKDYYTFNKSASGFFGTLDPDKFAGEDGCDFIEVYFNIEKKGGMADADVDYSFKVCAEFVTMKESNKIKK